MAEVDPNFSEAAVGASARAEPRLSDQAVAGVRWFGVARVLAEIVAFGSSVVLARFIPPAEFGYAAAALGIVGVVPAFLTQTLAVPVVQAAAPSRQMLQTAALLANLAGVLFVGLVVLVAEGVIDPLLGGRVASLAALGAPAAVAASVGTVGRAMLQRRLAFRTLGLIEVAALFAGSGTSTLLAVAAGLDGEAIILGFVVVNGVVGLLSLVFAPLVVPRWGGRAEAGALLAFGLPAGGSALLATSFRSVDYIVLAARLRAADVGFYWRAFTLGVEYQTKISVIMQRVAFPVFARAPSAADLRRLRLRAVATHTAFLFPLLVTIAAVAPVLVPWLFGERWEPAVLPTQILTLAGMMAALTAGSPALVLALGRPQALLAYNVVSVVGLAVVAYLAAPLGVAGVAGAVVGFYFLLLVANHAWLLHGIGRIPLRDLWAETAPALVSCVPLAAVEFATVELLTATGAPAFPVLAAAGLLGLAAYVAALRLAFPRSLAELHDLTSRVVGLRHPDR